jgi:hypothetical protein
MSDEGDKASKQVKPPVPKVVNRCCRDAHTVFSMQLSLSLLSCAGLSFSLTSLTVSDWKSGCQAFAVRIDLIGGMGYGGKMTWGGKL